MATVERINPPGLFELGGFSRVVVAYGGRTAYIAGQGAFDAGMNLIGRGDLHAQTVQALRNLSTALQALRTGRAAFDGRRGRSLRWPRKRRAIVPASAARHDVYFPRTTQGVAVSAGGLLCAMQAARFAIRKTPSRKAPGR